MDITGEGCLEFFTNRRKVTAKWAYPSAAAQAPVAQQGGATVHMDVTDRANFNGIM